MKRAELKITFEFISDYLKDRNLMPDDAEIEWADAPRDQRALCLYFTSESLSSRFESEEGLVVERYCPLVMRGE